MALTRQQKEQVVKDISSALPEAASAAFVAFDGLSVTDVTQLRDDLYKAGVKMRVLPKRLLKIALKDAKIDFDPTGHDGQVAVVWGTDAVAPAKIIYEFASKKKETLRLLAGVLEGRTLSLEEITSLAQLPSREQLLGQLVGVLAGPARGFVQVLSGVPRSLVYVLQAIKDKKPNS